ncbi:MAG: type II toxin-antitoxin system RelE/ParE family toxin [Armatimonadota bacterium]
MRLVVSAAAERDLGRLSRGVAGRVSEVIDALAREARPRGCLLLRDYKPPTWRVRVGDWRVLYETDDRAGVVTVTGIRHRGRAYY